MDSIFKYNMGSKAKDRITGVKGTITARSEFITGCVQYMLEGESKDNEAPKTHWVDEDRLVILESTKAKQEKLKGGPPQPTPPARPHP